MKADHRHVPMDPTFTQGHPLLGYWMPIKYDYYRGVWLDANSMMLEFGFRWIPWFDIQDGMRALK